MDRSVEVRTNVEKIFRRICGTAKVPGIEEEVIQLKAYDRGVGTGYSKWDQFSGGITGLGIDKHIKDMYTFICLNYQQNDKLFLFGFSRGAYTARSLAGLIRNCGLLKPAYINLVDKVYDIYRGRNEYTSPDSAMLTSWRSNYCIEDSTPIHFIGVWDTVGSLGIPLPSYNKLNQEKYKFHDQTLSSQVLHAYHALAIDERRKLFIPTLWKKSDATMRDDNNKQVLEQRWFAGVHSNIGGGYKDSGLSDIALHWLMDKASGAGLCYHGEPLNPPEPLIAPKATAELRNSYTSRYWFWRPQWRDIDLEDDVTNQTIDKSVWERYDADSSYRPGNLKDLRKK